MEFLSRLSRIYWTGDAFSHAPALPSPASVGLCFCPAGRSHHRQLSGSAASGQTLVGRESTVIHPPVDVSAFANPDMSQLKNVLGQPVPGSYYFWLGLLVSYKRVDLAVQACTATGRNLIVSRDGPEREKLEKMAGPTVRFVGRASSEAIPALYAGCKAFLFPGEEDFGITPLEASAAGRPVIAYGKGGALDSIIPDETGLFFEQQNTDSLIATLNSFETTGDTAWNVDRLKAHAQGFSGVLFHERMGAYIRRVIEDTN